MSIEALNWAFGLRLSDPSAKLVLLALANHHNIKSEVCWPSLDLLARETGAARRTITRAIQRLERLGLITVDRSPRKSNVYFLRLESWQPSWALEAGATEDDLAVIGITIRQRELSAKQKEGLYVHPQGQSGTADVPNWPPSIVTLATHPWQSGTLIIMEPSFNLSENRREIEEVLSDFEMRELGWTGPSARQWKLAAVHA